MNILQVCLSYGWGGLEMYVLELTKLLRKKGHNVNLLTAVNSSLNQKAEDFTPLCLKPRMKYLDLLGIWRIRDIIHDLKPEVIHLHCAGDLWLVVPAVDKSRQNTRLIFTDHMASVYPKKDLLHRLLYGKLKWAIVTTEEGRKKMLASCPIPPERIKTIYYGIDLDKFHPEIYDREKIRSELNLSPETVVIGIIGRIDPQKGQKEFLLATREVVKDFPGSNFLVIGPVEKGYEDYEKELRKIATDTLLNGKVIFTGFRGDIPEILSAIDIFVLASHCEAFGLVLVEAMAMGKAVIGTNAGGVPEIIEHNKNGLLVPPEDWRSLAEALRRLVSDQNLSLVLSQNARKTVEEKFSLDKHLYEIEKVYENNGQ